MNVLATKRGWKIQPLFPCRKYLDANLKWLEIEQGYVKDIMKYADVVRCMQSLETFFDLSATRIYLGTIFIEKTKVKK